MNIKYLTVTFKLLHGNTFFKDKDKKCRFEDKGIFKKTESEINEAKKALKNYIQYPIESMKKNFLDELIDIMQTITTIISINYSEDEIKGGLEKNRRKNIERKAINYNFNKEEIKNG